MRNCCKGTHIPAISQGPVFCLYRNIRGKQGTDGFLKTVDRHHTAGLSLFLNFEREREMGREKEGMQERKKGKDKGKEGRGDCF